MSSLSDELPTSRLTLDALLTRASVSSRFLSDPAPSQADVDLMIEVAARTPDLDSLRPGRFICVEGNTRERLGDVFASAFGPRNPGASPEQLDRQSKKPLRAPLVIGVAAAIDRRNPNIREIDQQLSAGAAAMNLLNAAHILGFDGIMLTGESCHDPVVETAVGLEEEDFIAGWSYLGTPVGQPTSKPGVSAVGLRAKWCGWINSSAAKRSPDRLCPRTPGQGSVGRSGLRHRLRGSGSSKQAFLASRSW
jgi:nitroreductase